MCVHGHDFNRLWQQNIGLVSQCVDVFCVWVYASVCVFLCMFQSKTEWNVDKNSIIFFLFTRNKTEKKTAVL